MWYSGGVSGGDSGVFSCGGCGSLRFCLRLWFGLFFGVDAFLIGGIDLDLYLVCGVFCSVVVIVCYFFFLFIK